MRHVDFSPLYRSTVGFDRLFTMLDSLGQRGVLQVLVEGGATVAGASRADTVKVLGPVASALPPSMWMVWPVSDALPSASASAAI